MRYVKVRGVWARKGAADRRVIIKWILREVVVDKKAESICKLKRESEL